MRTNAATALQLLKPFASATLDLQRGNANLIDALHHVGKIKCEFGNAPLCTELATDYAKIKEQCVKYFDGKLLLGPFYIVLSFFR